MARAILSMTTHESPSSTPSRLRILGRLVRGLATPRPAVAHRLSSSLLRSVHAGATDGELLAQAQRAVEADPRAVRLVRAQFADAPPS
jgi:hypothetical protein